MGNTLDKPKTDKDTTIGCSEDAQDGLYWGVSSMQGWRLSMEDAHICASPEDDLKVYADNCTTTKSVDGPNVGPSNQLNVEKETANGQSHGSKDSSVDETASATNGNKKTGSDDPQDQDAEENLRLPPHHYFFCVLDGHGGDFAAQYGRDNLLPILLEQENFQEYERLWRKTTTLSTTTTTSPSFEGRSSGNAANKIGSGKKRKQAWHQKNKDGNNNNNKWNKNASQKASGSNRANQKRRQKDAKLLEQQSQLLQRALEDAFVELDLLLLQEMVHRKMVCIPATMESRGVRHPHDADHSMEDDDWGTFDRMEEEVDTRSNLTKSQNTKGDTIPGTTVVAVLVTPDWILCANLGDSRASLLLSSAPSQTKSDPACHNAEHTNNNNKKKNNKQKGNKNKKKGGSIMDECADFHSKFVDDGNSSSKSEGDYYWTIIALSEDHKPDLPEEQARIETANGSVTMGGRVDGELAVSRALGDFGFKEGYPRHLYGSEAIQKRRGSRRKRRQIQNSVQGSKNNGVTIESLAVDNESGLDWERQRAMAQQLKVSPFPEVFAYPRGKSSKEDKGKEEPGSETESPTGVEEVLLLGCDGIWDVMTNENCHNLVQELLAEGETNMGLIAEEILDTCLKKGSRDNMTMMVVYFADEKSTSAVGKGIDTGHAPSGGGVLKRRKQRNSVDRASK